MRIRIVTLLFVATFAIAGLAHPSLTLAAEAPDAKDVRVTLAPYAWLTGISGTVGVRSAQVHVDSSFADLSKYLNFAGMLHADILYRETFGFLAEGNYALLGDQASGKRVSLDGQMGLFLSDVAAYYRLGSTNLGGQGAAPSTLDVLAGVRIWSLSMNIKNDYSVFDRSISRQKAWVDPIIGLRAQLHLNENWGFEVRGGVGGFGASSAFTWDAMALLGYTFSTHGTAFLGYRAVGVNHEEGSGRDYFKFDATLSGPILGAAFTF